MMHSSFYQRRIARTWTGSSFGEGNDFDSSWNPIVWPVSFKTLDVTAVSLR